MAYPRQSVEVTNAEFIQLIQGLFQSPTDSGETVHHFETTFANFLGGKHAVSFPSQRAGMEAVLRTLDPKEGDEVIVPAYTFFSIPACVTLAGLIPVFVDVLPDTWNLDPSQVRSALTPRTRAIIVTHLNGCPADLDPLVQIARESRILLIEDCAQALGAAYRSKPVGTFGVGCFSFGDGKNLLAMGGGMTTTDDSVLAHRLRSWVDSFHRQSVTEILANIGRLFLLKLLTQPFLFSFTLYPWLYLASFGNGKVDTDRKHAIRSIPSHSLMKKFCNLQATLGLAQFRSMMERDQRRIENAKFLSQALRNADGIELPPEPSDRVHLYTHYAVRVKDREPFVRALIRRGIDAQRDYCSYCPKLPDFCSYGSSAAHQTPIARMLDGTVAYLPTQPSLGISEMECIAHAVREILAT